MKEDFLHYIWKFKRFETSSLKTTTGEEITLINVGEYAQRSGPDFFNAQILIGNQLWAGNVEIHINASDWYLHCHETDPAYDNVILHVVWNHDCEIFQRNNIPIPTLELNNYVDETTLQNYNELIKPKSWIFCERSISEVSSFTVDNLIERLFLERLESKSGILEDLLLQSTNDWDGVLFKMLAKNFGLNANGDAFLEIASRIPYHVLRKEIQNRTSLEALLLGFAGLLYDNKEDNHYRFLQVAFERLCNKHQLDSTTSKVDFFKHRPDNFPTIRLSQLAGLLQQSHLFSNLIGAKTRDDLHRYLQSTVSEYWQTHYVFDKESAKRNKKLSASFIDLLIINTVIPLQFAYARALGKDNLEELIQLLSELNPESNAIIEKFGQFDIIAKNAYESQGLIHLKKNYCDKIKCMECAIGTEILKNNAAVNG